VPPPICGSPVDAPAVPAPPITLPR
jgi:hypothetical protein